MALVLFVLYFLRYMSSVYMCNSSFMSTEVRRQIELYIVHMHFVVQEYNTSGKKKGYFYCSVCVCVYVCVEYMFKYSCISGRDTCTCKGQELVSFYISTFLF